MLTTIPGKFIMTFLISMIPVIELRGGLPYGILNGLSLPLASLAAVTGNMLPVPFILFFIEKIFELLRKYIPKMNNFICRMESRAASKRETIEKYGYVGLLILVAIPLPGTGAWTGSMIAAVLNIRMKRAIPPILVGVVIAGLLVSLATSGVVTWLL